MASFLERITSSFKKPTKTIGDFFAPVPNKVRVRDVARETPKATLNTLQDIGQASFRGFGSIASLITGKPFKPEGTFQEELFGTDKPITITSFGRENRGADPQGKSKGAFKVIDPTLGLFFGLADAIPGGSSAKKGVQQSVKGAKVAKSKIPDVFKGFKDLTTKTLEKLRGRSSVSKQFIADLTNTPDLRQAERDLLRGVLDDMPDTVPVKEFADRVKIKLLPLKIRSSDDLDQSGYVFNNRELRELADDDIFPNRYENISLPDNLRGNVASYSEHIYQSPIKNATGGVHFDEKIFPNYFAHVRVEDLAKVSPKELARRSADLPPGSRVPSVEQSGTRRIIEIQSDLFQKKRLDREAKSIPKNAGLTPNEIKQNDVFAKKYIDGTLTKSEAKAWKKLTDKRGIGELQAKRAAEVQRLQPYRGTWHERIIREEIKRAARDGKARLQFPTGKTAMQIESLGDADAWEILVPKKDGTFGSGGTLTADKLEEGMQILGREVEDHWVVTKVLGDGKFKAISEKMVNVLEAKFKKPFREIKDIEGNEFFRNAEETFDISGKIDTSNPIYRFYEKDVQRFLKRIAPNTKQVTDEQGVTWFEVDIDKTQAKAPVEAFGVAAGVEVDEDGNVDFDPLKAALGLGIVGGIKGFGPNKRPRKPTPKVKSETDSLELLAEQQDQSRFALHRSAREEEKLVSNLESIFADMKGVEVDDLKRAFSDGELEQAQFHYEQAVDLIMDNPARKLAKYANKRTGELPEVTGEGTSIFARRGDDIVTELGFEDSETARRAYEAYVQQRKELMRVQANLGEIRTNIRLAKQRDIFIGEVKDTMARQVVKNVKSLKNLMQAAERAGFRKGLTEGSKRLQSMVKRLKDRRSQIRAIKHAFNLTDAQMRKVRGNKDPRFMDDANYQAWFKELEAKAIQEQRMQEERVIINAIIKGKDLQKTDNLRVALKLPPIKNMTLEQLFQFDEVLSQYKHGDTFLGPRMIQTIVNTDIGPVKTVREIRESLAQQVGVSNLELTNVAGKWGDRFLYDPALAEENPLYKYMVMEWTGKKIEVDQNLLTLKKKLDELAFAARRSRKKKISDRLVPQDKLVFDYLETPIEEKGLAKQRMTPAEIEFAEFVEGLFKGYRNILLEKGTLKRYRKNYITHTTRSFFERWKDDGFIRAIGTYWESLTEQRVDFDAIGETGEVLGLEKFFKFALQREGGLAPSKNVARAVMTYARAFEKKQALDQMIPKVDAYTFSLQRSTNIKDPTGLNVDGRLQQFVRQWLNNKKGRRVQFVVSQGGKMDARLRALKLFISVKDLGFNVITGAASLGGNVIANYVGLTTRAYATGIKRALSKRGKALALKHNGVIGEPVFENIISASNDVGDTFLAGAFGILQDLAYRARRQFLLGSLTKDEWRTGEISAKRLTEIRLEMGKFHPLDEISSVIGSTPEAQLVTMYKSWAVPFLMTARTNAKKTIKAFKEAETLTGKAKTLKTKEAQQLAKLTVGGLGVYTFFHTIFEDDNADDDSFVAKLKRRFVRETASSLSALNPNTWLSIRPLDFVQDIAEGIELLVKLERYKTSGSDFEEGDLKGLKKIQRELTPSVIRQFRDTSAEKSGNRDDALTVEQLLGGGQKDGTGRGGSSRSMSADDLLQLTK